ncbi:uncharacterized protein LOC100574705 [Acyrthosiphon pisum]|uniref:Uncharacterized protein n=1 Tax=Acyrthosiphon pisum TaxID=7029 RepID=A0A8R2ABM3_ACYPI|nr:uncharacterized protein LOC100574705 [Acyrthosiphon pisum]|eukprot:XP_003243494.1 PREDICTED: uncharacterized protein LOC100574705 [Acyrthosiphon pisum]
MAFNNSATVSVEGNATGATNRHTCKMRNKRMWKSLRAHILSRREKSKQDEADAELLRKQKFAEDQKMQENKLSLAQINGRLSELRDKRDELEEEKRELLNQNQTIINTVIAVPEPKCANYDRELVTKIKFKSSIVPDIAFLRHQRQQHQQKFLDLLTTTPRKKIPSPMTLEELSPISESVVIPTDVKERSEQNFWIIHQPN